MDIVIATELMCLPDMAALNYIDQYGVNGELNASNVPVAELYMTQAQKWCMYKNR